jgi:hypothetical protein
LVLSVLSVLSRQVALRLEFVAQVVEGVRFAVCVGVERRPGGGDEVVQVVECAGEPSTETADLGVQVVCGFGRGDHLLFGAVAGSSPGR